MTVPDAQPGPDVATVVHGGAVTYLPQAAIDAGVPTVGEPAPVPGPDQEG